MSKILYLKIEQKIQTQKKEVLLKDIAKMECSEQEYVNRLNTEKFMNISEKGRKRYVCSVLTVIEQIHKVYPNLEVQNLGEADFLIYYEGERSKSWVQWMKALVLCLIIFFGSAFSIMTFQEDAGVSTIFDMIYESVLGSHPKGLYVIEISYAVGLSIGILLFFNHLGRSYLSKDPTPISVEMKNYEKQVNEALISENARRGNELDVD